MEWSTFTPRDVKANAALYWTMFVRNSFAWKVSEVNKLYRGRGGTRRGGNFTLPCPQHIPNSGWPILDDETRSSIQWRASQYGQRIFILPKSLTCKLSRTGRRAIPKKEFRAISMFNLNKMLWEKGETYHALYHHLRHDFPHFRKNCWHFQDGSVPG